MLLPDSTAGLVIAALRHIDRVIGDEDRAQLRRVRRQVPEWSASALDQLAA